jgi:AcrR family transcriptional regulator
MKAIATNAAVSTPTVEKLFGTKARVLKAAIDVAIAGDDEPVPVLDRGWATAAASAGSLDELLVIVSGAVRPAQQRSAGLVLAAFEGSSTDAELGALAAQLITQRTTTAAWIVDAVSAKVPLRDGSTRADAIDTVWVLMDPAVFDRLTRRREWTPARYERWFAQSVRRLLVADTPTPTTARKSTTPGTDH